VARLLASLRQRWVAVLVLVASTAAAGYFARHWPLRLLCGYLEEQIESGDDRTALRAVATADRLGEAGVPLLVAAMGSYRAVVATESARRLDALLKQLRRQPARRSGPQLLLLSRCLAASVEQFGPAAKGEAADLARRIIRIPVDSRQVDEAALVSHCEAVILAAQTVRTASVAQRYRYRRKLADSSPRPIAAESRIEDEQPADPQPQSDVPGGGLDPRPVHVPAVPQPRLEDIPSGEPPKLLPGTGESDKGLSEPDRLHRPARPKRVPQGNEFGTETPDPAGNRLDAPELPRQLPSGEPSSNNGSGQRDSAAANEQARAPTAGLLPTESAFDSWTAEQVMQVLRGEPAVAQEAERELTRRGYSPTEVEIARQLTSPETEVRLRLVDHLPQLGGVDARAWLWHLAEDPQPAVRLAALSSLATSRDPAALRKIETAARSDSDARIRQLAERLSRQRRQTRR